MPLPFNKYPTKFGNRLCFTELSIEIVNTIASSIGDFFLCKIALAISNIIRKLAFLFLNCKQFHKAKADISIFIQRNCSPQKPYISYHLTNKIFGFLPFYSVSCVLKEGTQIYHLGVIVALPFLFV